MTFADRHEAGRQLAVALAPLGAERPIVVALPRGGVPVGVEVAAALHAPLDVLAVRKLGAPGQPEYGVGAVAEDGVGVLDAGAARAVGLTDEELDRAVVRESAELARRVAAYRDGRAPVDVRGRTALVVDDGLATGLSDLAAVRALRGRGAGRIVVGAPVGSAPAVAELRREADDVVCVEVPRPFRAVGLWYDDFRAVEDHEVVALLAKAWAATDEPIVLEVDGARLAGDLTRPAEARGLVIFAHGSGSSRRSARNRAVARTLQRAGLATLLLDLLDAREGARRDLVFDIPLLAGRVAAAIAWARGHPELGALPVGLFGASTGAAAALSAAARMPDAVSAIVSRGGRPDLAGDDLEAVRAPVLLIVGGADERVLALNRRAAARLAVEHRLEVVPGATHLFEEPGALEQVADLAVAWLAEHLGGPGA
jgi:predicted phosphoribosyltransferase/dienelactone hydrolase